MAKFVLLDCDVFTNGYEFSSKVNTLTVNAEADSLPTTNFASGGWEEMVGGIKRGMIDYSGFASHGSGEISTVLRSDGTLGGSCLVSVSKDNTENGDAFSMKSTHTTVTAMGGAVGEVAPISASFKSGVSGGGFLAGRLIATNASRTSSSASTGYQYGALTSSQRLYSALHVTSASGTSPTLDVVIQSDDNSGFSSATSRITHTQFTDIGSELSSVAGAVADDYWRASWTIGGSDTPTFRFCVVLAIV